jgi:hypothetical protein
MIEVWFDGIMWAARKRGFPGRVFARTPDEALHRARSWAWQHVRTRRDTL